MNLPLVGTGPDHRVALRCPAEQRRSVNMLPCQSGVGPSCRKIKHPRTAQRAIPPRLRASTRKPWLRGFFLWTRSPGSRRRTAEHGRPKVRLKWARTSGTSRAVACHAKSELLLVPLGRQGNGKGGLTNFCSWCSFVTGADQMAGHRRTLPATTAFVRAQNIIGFAAFELPAAIGAFDDINHVWPANL